ncbi:hypothetical protein PUN28_005360 [Cardiocondyla obscurior]|uniref:Uncharacterized protein n=1 Tax=Cardiocondyla obscurior TaxID=286306 RepID=A0AAW2GFH4_9HYME
MSMRDACFAIRGTNVLRGVRARGHNHRRCKSVASRATSGMREKERKKKRGEKKYWMTSHLGFKCSPSAPDAPSRRSPAIASIEPDSELIKHRIAPRLIPVRSRRRRRTLRRFKGSVVRRPGGKKNSAD